MDVAENLYYVLLTTKFAQMGLVQELRNYRAGNGSSFVNHAFAIVSLSLWSCGPVVFFSEVALRAPPCATLPRRKCGAPPTYPRPSPGRPGS